MQDPDANITFEDGFIPIISKGHLGDYEEDYQCLFVNVKDGKFYDISGGHCSCYGFEEQFKPEIVELEEIFNNKGVGLWSKNSLQVKEVLEFLAKLESEKN